jgi:hypothetical protein
MPQQYCADLRVCRIIYIRDDLIGFLFDLTYLLE